MADDRRLVRNLSGCVVAIDIGRDMDEATFDSMVERGDLTPVEPEPKKASRKK